MNRNDILSRFPDATDEYVKAILDINSADITKALNKQSGEIQGLNDRITQSEASITQLTAQHQKEMESANSKHSKEIADLNAQLQAATNKAVVVDTLTEKVNSLTQTLAERDKTIADNARSYRLRDELRRVGAHNPDVVMPLLKQDVITEKDGKFEGFTEQIDALKQSDPYLFTTPPVQRGGFDGRQDLTSGAKSTKDVANENIRGAFIRH